MSNKNSKKKKVNKVVYFINQKKRKIQDKFRKIINIIVDFVKNFFLKIKKNYKTQKEIRKQKYNSLAPRDDIKNNATVDMLIKALKDDKNKNIALSGKYGAGKTSIVLTALKKRKHFKPLYISLGMLGIEKKNEKEDNQKERLEQEESRKLESKKEEIKEINIEKEKIEAISKTIEKSIIQQIIYKEKSNKFPASKIKRIPYINKITVFLIILVMAFFKLDIVENIITDFFFIVKSAIDYIFCKFNNNSIILRVTTFYEENLWLAPIIKLVILLLVIYVVSKYIVNTLRKYSLENIKIKFFETNDIEIKNTEESLINKYMDELVYFFEMTKYNVVVIEDLDRFLQNEELRPKILIIFQKLKELNQILNTSKQLYGRKVTFLYVMRDDLFYNEEERTKFFDFIVPKISEISSYNSYAKLKQIINDKEISNKFLQEISPYVKDYRVIKNLKNEFNVYTQEIKGQGIVKEKLLAMIVFKNLRPQEYERLIKEEGVLYKFIKNKNNLYKNKKDELEEIIKENKKEIKKLEEEKIKDFKELKYLALGNLACINTGYVIGSTNIEKSEFLKDSYGLKAIEENIINIKDHNGYEFTEEKLFESFGGKDNFIKRAKTIIKNNSEEVRKIQEENKKIEENIKKIQKLNISELLKENDSKYIKELEELEVMMLKNGYIDENYENYCFKYIETDEITRHDFSYILNVRQDKSTYYAFKIEKPDNVIKELDEAFFEKKTIWNYYILEKLQEQNSEKLAKFINTLLMIDEETYDFITGYIRFSKDETKILKLLYTQRREILYEILNYGLKNGKNIDNLIELILNMPDYLSEENLKDFIRDYIKEDVKSRIWFKINNKVEQSLIILDIKFSKIYDKEENEELLKVIYENNLYELNEEMIRQIFKYKKMEDKFSKDYTFHLILKVRKLEKLKLYILENKEEFLNNCFMNMNISMRYGNDLIECLNTWDVESSLKSIIIMKICRKISNISNIKDTSTYKYILKYEKMEACWENIFAIYCITNEITGELMEYIEKNIDILEKRNISFEVPKNQESIHINFQGKLARNNDIEYSIYKKIIKKLDIVILRLEKDKVKNCRLDALVKENLIKLNENTFSVITKQNNMLIEEFISSNINDFIEHIEKLELDANIIEKVILSNKIIYKYKNIILSKIDNKLLSVKSIEYIIENYKKVGIKISYHIKKYIFSYDINIESKIKLLIKELQKNTELETIKEYISSLPIEYRKIGDTDYKQTSIKRTKLNQKLINALEGKLKISQNPTKNRIIIYNLKENKSKMDIE